MRGQAFIVFENEDDAEKALNTMDGATFYQVPMMINYARKHSDVIAKKKGTFDEAKVKQEREKRDKDYKEWIEYVRNLRTQEKLNKLST